MQRESIESTLKKNVVHIWLPIVFSMVLLIIQILSFLGVFNILEYGLLPRSESGLKGIITMHFVHAGWEHFSNNIGPIFFLGMALFYFFGKTAYSVFLWSIVGTGLWVWVGARANIHIGASGLIYAWGAFLFLKGVMSKSIPLMGLSLLIAFLYGSMIWGIFPLKPGISWEGHLFGMLCGILLAWVYKKEGLKPVKYQWEEEEEAEDDFPYWEVDSTE